MNINNQEFEQLIEDHSRMIYKIAGAYCNIAADRDDLISEIILQMWQSVKNFKHQCKISTWIYRVALNTAMNASRKRKNESLFLRVDFQKTPPNIPIIEAEYTDELEILYQCINELSEINKALILLQLDGKTYDEMAEITGMSKTNVGTRINRIKEQLRKMVILK
ncbi:MAG TPA: sigma-70 family RNA polymerase sigma factor [Prolixibacteraceae bacterium]|nr:sigma-70 family RNA polymerase sigma factor [Prolixibacteraceae bacterium]